MCGDCQTNKLAAWALSKKKEKSWNDFCFFAHTENIFYNE